MQYTTKRTFLVSLALVTMVGCQTIPVAKNASVLDVNFTWSERSGCSIVSPVIEVGNIPQGTHYLSVEMKDLDKLSYYHGGGEVAYSGNGVIPEGALTSYRGPCPPAGSHTYKFTVQALNKSKDLILGEGESSRKYPE